MGYSSVFLTHGLSSLMEDGVLFYIRAILNVSFCLIYNCFSYIYIYIIAFKEAYKSYHLASLCEWDSLTTKKHLLI